MKLKNQIAILLVMVSFAVVNSQEMAVVSTSPYEIKDNKPTLGSSPVLEFTVQSYRNQIIEITGEMAGSHIFGSDVARLDCLFESVYTYNMPVSPGNPTMKTIIEKPLIYSAVKKIEKQLKKDYRNQVITYETATKKFNKVLEVAICVFRKDTAELEARIKAASDQEKLLELFTENIKLNYID